jgi:hypothetical protein
MLKPYLGASLQTSTVGHQSPRLPISSRNNFQGIFEQTH